MIKKLRNQPYAPKVGAKRKKKKLKEVREVSKAEEQGMTKPRLPVMTTGPDNA
jgi:hypothetical protein